MQTTTNSTSLHDRLVMAGAILIGSAIVLTLALPHDVLASAGSASGSGGAMPDAAKNFNKNGLASLKLAGMVVFGVAAAWGLARAAFGGKVGAGLMQAGVAAVGAAVVAGPDAVLQTVGGWGTDLFA